MRTANFSIRIQALMLIVGLLLAFAAQADFKRDYGSGIRDYDSGDYADAIKALQKAIDEEPNEQEKVRIYGMRYEPYLPYFYLGQAKFKNGDCAGALVAWKESISQGVVKNQSQFSELQTSMASCDTVKVDVSLIAKSAESAISTLEDNINRFAQLKNEKLLASEWASRWEPELNSASSTAQLLKQRLATAVAATDETAIKAVESEARQTAAAISGTRGMAVAQVDSLKENVAQSAQKQRESARQSLTQAVNSGKSVKFSQGSEQMATLQKQMETLIGQGSTAIDNAATTPQEYQELAQNISNVSRRYASAEQDWQTQQRQAKAAEENAAAAKEAAQRRIPPNTLKRVAEAYFAGNYQDAIKLSDPNSLDEDRAKVQALLFRAASNFKLYVLSGETDSQAKQKSEDDIRMIKKLNKNFSPYIAAFSPKFLELFRQTG